MPTDLKATREALGETIERVEHLDRTLQEIAADAQEREKVTRRRITKVLVLVVVLSLSMVGALVFVGFSLRHQANVDTRIRDDRDADAFDLCRRGNDNAEIARIIVRWQYEDYNVAPANQTPERQRFLANRLEQRLRELDRLKPIVDCGEPPP